MARNPIRPILDPFIHAGVNGISYEPDKMLEECRDKPLGDAFFPHLSPFTRPKGEATHLCSEILMDDMIQWMIMGRLSMDIFLVFDEWQTYNLYQVDFPWSHGGKFAWEASRLIVQTGFFCFFGGFWGTSSGWSNPLNDQWQILQAYEQGVVQIEDSLKREANHTPMQNSWLFPSDISFLIIIINDNDNNVIIQPLMTDDHSLQLQRPSGTVYIWSCFFGV